MRSPGLSIQRRSYSNRFDIFNVDDRLEGQDELKRCPRTAVRTNRGSHRRCRRGRSNRVSRGGSRTGIEGKCSPHVGRVVSESRIV